MLSGVGRRLGASAVLGVFTCVSCHAPPRAAPVPVQGTRADLSALAGTWAGRYWSEATGRHGEVTFRLRAGADTAHGEVEMTFSRSLRLYGDAEVDDPALRRQPCTTIDIAIVRIEGSRLRGTLAPYWDPDCDCRVRTVFDGELAGDHIAGAFSTRRDADTASATGLWFADRERR